MPPKEPLMYRLYEIVQNYGYAYKAILNEKFGDGIMSAISFSTKVEKETDKDGNKWAVITLRGKWYVGLLIIIIMILLSWLPFRGALCTFGACGRWAVWGGEATVILHSAPSWKGILDALLPNKCKSSVLFLHQR